MVSTNPRDAFNYPEGFGRDYFMDSYMTSPYGEIGGTNPYLDAFNEHLESEWDELYGTVKAQKIDWTGPDFLHTLGTHPARLLEQYSTDEELLELFKEADSAGKAAALDQVEEIINNPSENQEDYIQILQLLSEPLLYDASQRDAQIQHELLLQQP